jgi:DNA-binding NarL/FixJ family response regulator
VTAAIRVLSVDDHPLMQQGIAAVLRAAPDMTLVGEAGNGLEAVERHRVLQPDVTLMDLQMPVMDGIEAIAAIRRESPHARFVVLTMYKGDVLAKAALQTGASAYLLKSMMMQDLLETIRWVHAGQRRIPAEVAIELAEHAADEPLSVREIEVLKLVAKGTSNKLIAADLQISEETVKVHMKHIMEKLGARDRTHAVTIAVKRGFIDL